MKETDRLILRRRRETNIEIDHKGTVCEGED
jgi:hypothetical protein